MDLKTINNEIASTAQARLERYDRLVALAEEQKAILLEGRYSDLPQNLAGFDHLLLELGQFDKREESLRQHLERAQGEREGTSDFDAKCMELVARTAEKATLLRTLTETNKQLLGNAMEYVHFSIGIICKMAVEAGIGDAGRNPAVMLNARV